MADNQQIEIKEETMQQEGTAEVKATDTELAEKKLYKLVKNVKYGSVPYKIGKKIEIKDEDLEEFKAIGAIEEKQDEELEN